MDIKLKCLCALTGSLAVMTHLVLLLTAVQGEFSEAREHSNMSVENWPHNGQLREIHINGAIECHHTQQLSILAPWKPLNFILFHSQNAGCFLKVWHIMDLHPTRNNSYIMSHCHLRMLTHIKCLLQIWDALNICLTKNNNYVLSPGSWSFWHML